VSSGLPLGFRRPSSVTNSVWLVHLVTIVILLVDSDFDSVLSVGADSSSRSLFYFLAFALFHLIVTFATAIEFRRFLGSFVLVTHKECGIER